MDPREELDRLREQYAKTITDEFGEPGVVFEISYRDPPTYGGFWDMIRAQMEQEQQSDTIDIPCEVVEPKLLRDSGLKDAEGGPA